MLYRIAKDEETAERIAAKIYNGEIDERGFRKLIRSLYPDVAAVYGWKIAGQKMWFRSGNTRMLYIDFQLNNYTQ